MKAALARDFGSIYDEICSPDASSGVPGTESQTYLHAKHLGELGKRGLEYLRQSAHTESAQKAQLKHIIDFLEKYKKPGYLQKQYGRDLFRVDKQLRINRARRILSDLQFAFGHKNWHSDVY
jgi:hypothetical protein